MNLDSIAKVIEAIARLIASVIWPLVFVFVLIRFRPELAEFLANIGEFSLKIAGVEAAWKKKQTEATAALTAAAVSRTDSNATPGTAARDAREAVQIVAEIATPRVIRRAARSRILWVDDRPNNNIHERESLEALGVTFALANSTEQALQLLKTESFNAIISDMGRPPDATAGYTLLDQLRAAGDHTPFIIYAGSRSPERQSESRRRGALGCTNRPNELFQMVLSVLGPSHDSRYA